MSEFEVLSPHLSVGFKTGCDLVREPFRGLPLFQLEIQAEVPAEFPGLNVMVHESTGAMYWVHAGLPLSPRRFVTVTIPLTAFSLPPWSADPNGKLDVNLIDQVGLGIETASSGQGKVMVADLQLVPAGW